jgi:hypothetical protein
LEKEIELLEKEKASLEEALSGGDLTVEQIHEFSERHSVIAGELDTKSDRWLELSERVDTIRTIYPGQDTAHRVAIPSVPPQQVRFF